MKLSDICKIVLLPIEVPTGDYCWGYSKGSWKICDRFSNEGGHPICELNLGDLEYTEGGIVLKPKRCIKLKEVKDERRNS